MDLSMSILQYQDYCLMVFKKELDAFWAELRSGAYQKKTISDYNKKYSLIDRLIGDHPERELIKACKESIKFYKKYGIYHVGNGLEKLVLDPFHKKLSKKTDEMWDDYVKCFMHEIVEKSKSCDKTVVKKIADKCYNQFETEYKNYKGNFFSFCLCITDAFLDASTMQIPLSSLGVNSISGKFEQAGLSAAVLVELRERYKVRFNEEISCKIAYSYDSADHPEGYINNMVKKGIYKQGKSYITMNLCDKTSGFILNI